MIRFSSMLNEPIPLLGIAAVQVLPEVAVAMPEISSAVSAIAIVAWVVMWLLKETGKLPGQVQKDDANACRARDELLIAHLDNLGNKVDALGHGIVELRVELAKKT